VIASRKQTVPLNGATSKGKVVSAIGGTVHSSAINQTLTIKDTGSSSPQGAATNAQAPLSQYKSQILQMLVDMKEQMKEQ